MKNRMLLFGEYLDILYQNPICELLFTKDYELLIAVVMSAQTTDKRVNIITPILFSKYTSLESLRLADVNDIALIIKQAGTFRKKAQFIKSIATLLLSECDGIVPNDRTFLESLPGVGRKTANVVLSVLYGVPTIAVDTHVNRVSKRLFFAKEDDSVFTVEVKLMKLIPKALWSKRHHQMVFFGRYQCKAIKPECSSCGMTNSCHHYQTVINIKSK